MKDYNYNLSDVCGVSKNIKDERIQPLNGLRHNDSEEIQVGFYREENIATEMISSSLHISNTL